MAQNKNTSEFIQESSNMTIGSRAEGVAMSEPKKDNFRMVFIVFISLLIDLLGFTMILPLLPSLLEYYGRDANDVTYNTLQQSVQGFREFVGAPDTPRWNSVLFGGLIGSLFSLLQFLSSPLVGAASDTYGRKSMLLLSLSGLCVSYILWAVSSNFTLFVIARIIGGISKGNVSVSTAVIADVTSKKNRGKGMATVGIAFSVAFIIGPILGAGFAKLVRSDQDLFFQAPALLALTLALVDIFVIVAFFKETLPLEKRAPSLVTGLSDSMKFINPVSLFKFAAVNNIDTKDLSSLRRYGLVYFLYLFFYSGLEFTLTFLVHNRFQYDSMQQGKMFFYIGVIMVLVQGGYVRRLPPGNERKIAFQGMMLLIPSFIVIGCTTNTIVFYIGLLFFAFASATVVPCLTTLVSSFGDEKQKGTVLGIFRSLGALARAAGPVVASTVFWSFGAVPCYMMGSVFLLLPLVLLQKMKPTTMKEN
ncbi:major facilitator superfamily domain-containing protein 10-like [Lineus longissimus]|uniref:major facilitator superfamily domain-containing protein 10-like n=1 Tax=Lineus longissimus TaxID=88925 RepID=UPI002B4E0B92